MASGTDLGIVIVIGVMILGGFYMIQQAGGLENLLGGGGGAPEPVEAPEPTETAPPAEAPDVNVNVDVSPEDMGAQPEVVPQYIPVPVAMPTGYGFRFPGYARKQICKAEFGGSCNSECMHGPTQICRDCVYFCGQPDYPRYRDRDRPKFFIKPRRGVSPRPNCGPDRHWEPREGKCVRDAGGPGPFPGDRDCPRGSRFDWSKKRCVQVPQPNPRPDDDPRPPRPRPSPTTPPGPAPTDGDRKRREEARQKIIKKVKERRTPAPSGGTPAVTSTYARSGCGCGG